MDINPANGFPAIVGLGVTIPSRFNTLVKRKTTTNNAAIMRSILVKFAEFICIPRLLMVYTKAEEKKYEFKGKQERY
jgi:hypothetical protein